MAGLQFDFLYAVDIESSLLVELCHILFGHNTEFAPCLGSKDLNFKIGIEFVFFCPNWRITSRPYLSIMIILVFRSYLTTFGQDLIA